MTTRERTNRKPSYGFTLIEILVVTVIIAMIVGLVSVNVAGALDKSRRNTAKAQISNFKVALDNFYVDQSFYPTSDMGLDALTEKPSDNRIQDYPEYGYLPKIPLDPWNNEYTYSAPGSNADYDIVSYGADGLQGGEGKNADVESWNL